jgi:hypothetical protein
MYDVIDKFIEDRLGTRSSENSDRSYSEKDLLDVLLEMRSDEFTLAHIRGYLTVSLLLLIDCNLKKLTIWGCEELKCLSASLGT